MRTRVRRLVATLQRHPTAADAVFAGVLSAAALVSVYATFELLRQDPAFKEPAKPGIRSRCGAVFRSRWRAS
jgi:hypothetical protein